FDELKHKSTKFIEYLDSKYSIKKSLLNLTVTVDYMKSGLKNFIYANFDPMNTLILRGKQGIT
ncbi:hypothetical protein K0B03_03140, partial [Patescibacteria group bacterium]|nr:hypothetical protein [Patescibacteria group bacterium]